MWLMAPQEGGKKFDEVPRRSSESGIGRPGAFYKRFAQVAGAVAFTALLWVMSSGSVLAGDLRYWLAPLLWGPGACAFAGGIYFAMEGLRDRGGWKKVIALVVPVLAYGMFVAVTFWFLWQDPPGQLSAV